MADKALTLNEQTGELVEVFANDLSEADKKNSYFCCGRPGGNVSGPICMAPLVLVTVNGRTNYFASLRDDSHHRPFCEYDESEEARIRGYLDQLGINTNLEELLETFNRPQEEEQEEETPDDGEEGKDNCVDVPNDEQNNLWQVVRVPMPPRAMKALVELLSYKAPDEPYAGKRVKDVFLNSAGIRELRVHSLANGSIKLAILNKVSMDRIKENYKLDFYGRGEVKRIVLVDAFSFGQKEQEQIFIIATEAYRKIYEAPRNSLVCVFANWRVHPRYPNVYMSIGNVEEGCIEIIDKSFLNNVRGDFR